MAASRRPISPTTGAELSAQRVKPSQVGAAGARDPGAVSDARADQAVLSSEAKDVLCAQKALAQQPDIRAEKVAELKQQIAGGTFKIDPELIAEKVIKGGP